MCVIAKKEELKLLYPLLEAFFSKEKTIKIYDSLNFYYYYLLLKTYFPKITFALNLIQGQITPENQLLTQISYTHKQIHSYLIDLGIPCLKEYNISNLMCDIFIPQYQDLKSRK